jgi:ferrous iron transport protein B
VHYSKDIETAIDALQHQAEALGSALPYAPRWTAIKLLEDDRLVREKLQRNPDPAGETLVAAAGRLRRHVADRFDEDPEIVMTDERYGFIAGIIKEVQATSARQRIDVSRNIDRVLTNRFLGFPLFILFIWAMFQLTFQGGAYPMAWLDAGVGALARGLERLLPDTLVKELLLDGVVAGVGSVIVFLPNILILFFCIALFEDTGYMARAAFLMDKIMHLIGLHGKSFIPMLMGFGCNVPAIMASRTLENEKDRLLTILITPFMSCSAKLPVYIVLAGTFFGPRAGNVIFAIYLTGILLSFLTGRLFRSLLFRGEDAPFVMELPPYRVPMLRSLLIHMWDRSQLFLRKMAGVILVGSVLVWGLSNFPSQIPPAAVRGAPDGLQIETGAGLADEEAARERRRAIKADRAAHSAMGAIGRWIEPLFAPIGIDWRGAVALTTGFVAKEIVVSTLGVLHAVGEGDAPEMLGDALRASGMTPLSALAMMIFVLLYLPCLASVAAIRRETRSVKWTLFSIAYSTALAWLAAFAVFQGGRLMGWA